MRRGPAVGSGDGRLGQAAGGPWGSGPGLERGPGTLGRPVGAGGIVSDRDAPGRWDEPGGEQGAPLLPRERGSRPSASTLRAPAGRWFVWGEQEKRPAQCIFFYRHRRPDFPAPGSAFSFSMKLSVVGCIIISQYIAARFLLQPAASRLLLLFLHI